MSALPQPELSELELEMETTSPLDEDPDELLDESAAGALAAMQNSCRALSSPLSSQVCTTRTLRFFPLSLRVLRLRVWKRLRSPDFAAAHAEATQATGGKPFVLGWESIIFDVRSTSTGHCRQNEQEKS